MRKVLRSQRKPSIEFDGAFETKGDKLNSCAVQIWFSSNPYDPMTISVMAPAVEGDLLSPTQIKTQPGLYCSAGCEVNLSGVRVSRWTTYSQPTRRNLHHEMELSYVNCLLLRHRHSLRERNPPRKPQLKRTFFVKLSESAYLSPKAMPRPDKKGVLKFEHFYSLKTKHPLLGVVQFERYYRFSPLEEKDVHVSSELIATLGKPLRTGQREIDSQKSAEAFDDFCSLASAASRQRVAVRGWQLSTTKVFEEAFLEPLDSGVRSFNTNERDTLIPREYASVFLEQAAKAWQLFSGDDLRKLRHACYALAPFEDRTIEGDYLTLFPALEGLISIHTARHGGGLVYSNPSTWNTIRKELSKALDSIVVDDPQFNRAAIKRNLPALKRIPLAELTTSILQALGSWSEQLWPLFDTNGPSLASIRNTLAHGEQLDPEKIDAVMVANKHLRTILERTLCRTLGWALTNTSVSDDILFGQKQELAREIRSARSMLVDVRSDKVQLFN